MIDHLRKLEEIGGDVEMAEVIYQCGRTAPHDLMEAEREGLVAMRIYFTLTPEGRAVVGETS